MLASCYANSLQLAADNECASIVFQLISAGIFGCPAEIAIAVAIHADRAVTYQCDEEGTALNYEVLGAAIHHVRSCSEPLMPCWKRRIDEDVKRRVGRGN